MSLLPTDGDLLEMVAGALAPAPIRPTPADYEQLRRALASSVPSPELQLTPRKVSSLRRLPHPVAAMVAVAVLTTGGAAAAVSTNTLPGPLRNFAFAVGLPVTSPALEQVDGDLASLRAALTLGDETAIRTDAATLRRDLEALGPADRVTASAGANLLLTRADGGSPPMPRHRCRSPVAEARLRTHPPAVPMANQSRVHGAEAAA